MFKLIVLPMTILVLTAGSAFAGQSNHGSSPELAMIDLDDTHHAADWGVRKIQVGSRKKVKRGKSERRSKTVRRSTASGQRNFAVPGGFRLRRGGFNDDHTPGNGQ